MDRIVDRMLDAMLNDEPLIRGTVSTVPAVTIRGEAMRESDPKYRGEDRKDNRIYRVILITDLPAVTERWLDMGRRITGIHY